MRSTATSHRDRWLVLSIVVLGLNVAAFGQDSLQDVRDAVRSAVNDEPPPQSSTPSSAPTKSATSGRGKASLSGKSDRDCDEHHSHDDFGLGTLIGTGLTAPFWLPVVLVGDGYDETMYFPSFPYDFSPGYQQPYYRVQEDWWRLRKSRQWSGRVSAEYGDAFDNQYWTGGRALLDTSWRLGLEADARRFEESRGPRQHDMLWLGDVNAVFRFAHSEHWQFRAGAGANWFNDDIGAAWGFNLTYGADWYPVEPLVFSSELDLGSLGDAFYFHGRTSAGVVWHGLETYVAFDYFSIGDAQLLGIAGGLRVWF